MKYKLPDGFKLSKNTDDNDLYIYNEVNNHWAYHVKSIKEALELIHNYIANSNLIKEVNLPQYYDITTGSGITNHFCLYYKDVFQKQSDNIQDLIKIATKTTELDLQIKALNEGLEIEL